jgi:hypothetical protein
VGQSAGALSRDSRDSSGTGARTAAAANKVSPEWLQLCARCLLSAGPVTPGGAVSVETAARRLVHWLIMLPLAWLLLWCCWSQRLVDCLVHIVC